MQRHYKGWAPDFWRTMGRREFYGYVDQAQREVDEERGDPESWQATDQDPWWQEARRRRDEQMGR